MDDLKFRRNLYAEPNSQDPQLLAAIDSDPKRQEFTEELKGFDQKIQQALKIDVPDDLAHKLLLKQAIKSHSQSQRKTRIHLALAASVAFAVGVGFNLVPSAQATQSVTAYAMAHVMHEKNYFSNSAATRVSLTSLNNEMSELNGAFKTNIGELMAAGYCTFEGVRALHLVYQGEQDSVAVFILPNAEHLNFKETELKGSLKAVAKQYKNKQVIIVGQAQETLSTWQSKVDENLQWSI